MKTIICNKDLRLERRVRALRCYVFSILQYELESWTLKQEDRRMLRIAWT
ncbi:unnamed protein product [Diabrotica balteata]|uniref:Uncharacterized protein n=1 Tax=Diabrotica balteata TaxID=107213 RepID=A0A9N9T986_DIABA|nr:unnamed protein product [Diabrotica balteata]